MIIHNPLILGQLGSAYGIRGWIKLISFTEKKTNIFFYQPWFLKKYNSNQRIKKIELEKWENKKHSFIIKLKGINDREEAKQVNNYYILIESSQLPLLNEGEYYWKDIIGCVVITADGDQLGKVVRLFSTISNDILVVNVEERYKIKEIFIPFIENQVISKIDCKSKLIFITWKAKFLIHRNH
ncbi:MAG: ribosome maturation factor RimM [Candidatus Dasytiphilus stammeri]